MRLYISELLSEAECSRLRAAFDENEHRSTQRDFSGQPVLRLPQFREGVEDLLFKCQATAIVISTKLGNAPAVLESTILTRMREGGWHAAHCDNCNEDGSPNHTPHRSHTAIVYLSRCHGGELVFPEREVWVAPSPGQLVVFPSDREHLHGVNAVTEGERYTLVMWLTGDPKREERMP